MKDGICLECGAKTVLKDNKNLYLALSKFQDLIAKHTEESNKLWRANAKNETSKYLKQGLVDRAVTRDLDWGVDIPVDGYENKKCMYGLMQFLDILLLQKMVRGQRKELGRFLERRK